MNRILIFGNSGSGKSTLAKKLASSKNIAVLDLDTVAWLPTNPPERASLADSLVEMKQFMKAHESWIMEGCYADLLEAVSHQATEIIFMNLDPSLCIENAKNRPWESHKYPSKAAQDRNLDMLITWIGQYTDRDDACSYQAHLNFYEQFQGKKTSYTTNQ